MLWQVGTGERVQYLERATATSDPAFTTRKVPAQQPIKAPEPPEPLPLHLAPYWEAFQCLNGLRGYTMAGARPFTLGDILLYCDRLLAVSDPTTLTNYVAALTIMDEAYREHVAEELSKARRARTPR